LTPHPVMTRHPDDEKVAGIILEGSESLQLLTFI